MMKKMIAMLCIVVVAASLFQAFRPKSAMADVPEILTTTGVLLIDGTGEMKQYDDCYDSNPLFPLYRNYITTKELTTEEATTEIPKPDADFKISSKTLLLSSGISIVFKVKKDLFECRYSEPVIYVRLNGEETEIYDYTEDGNGKYAFEFKKITPDMMNATVTASLCAYKNGRVYESPVIEYSVATYCYNMLNKIGETPGYEKLRTLLVELLNYGAASQNYTGVNTDNPANSKLTAGQRSWGTAELGNLTNVKNAGYQTVTNPVVTWKSAELALQDGIIASMKFQADYDDNLIICVKDDYGTTWEYYLDDCEPVQGTDNQYYINFRGFNVGRMSDNMYFTAYKGNTPVSDTYRYSVESYAFQHVNDGDSLGELVIAMMKYGNSAKAFSS